MKFKKPDILTIILGIVIILPYFGMGGIFLWNKHEAKKIENASFIVISKEDMTLTLYDYKGKILDKFSIACGKNLGNKQIVGDMKTHEGTFTVCDIQNSAHWTHDFGDGNGEIQGAYGPFFIRLLTPGHRGIGIHSTHNEKSIGTRVTEGCIRLKNENLEKLVTKIKIGTVVVITTSKKDVVN